MAEISYFFVVRVHLNVPHSLNLNATFGLSLSIFSKNDYDKKILAFLLCPMKGSFPTIVKWKKKWRGWEKQKFQPPHTWFRWGLTGETGRDYQLPFFWTFILYFADSKTYIFPFLKFNESLESTVNLSLFGIFFSVVYNIIKYYGRWWLRFSEIQ